MNQQQHHEPITRTRITADVDAPDKIVYGLTFRQLAVLACVGVVIYGGWRELHGRVPNMALVAAGVVVGGLGFALAVGRRDGLSLDLWLLAAIRHRRAPKTLSTTHSAAQAPDWVRTPGRTRVSVPAPLHLPADAIGDDGEITLGGGRAAMVAASTVNLALRTAGEQAALVDGFGMWLNSLSSPTQIVVSAQPVDLRSHAAALAQTGRTLPHPALEAACVDHAAFLDDLAQRRDPLRRRVLVVTRANPGERGDHVARRRADDTARSLSGLGVLTRALDGAAVTAALAAAADPYRPPRPGGLAAPDTVITATPAKPRKAKP